MSKKLRDTALIMSAFAIAVAGRYYYDQGQSEKQLQTANVDPVIEAAVNEPAATISAVVEIEAKESPLTNSEEILEQYQDSDSNDPDQPAWLANETIRSLMDDVFYNLQQGNTEQLAILCKDTAEQAGDYPELYTQMRHCAGYSYEKLGFIDMAIEQHQLSLIVDPEHSGSYPALRRLDAGFARENPALKRPVNDSRKAK